MSRRAGLCSQFRVLIALLAALLSANEAQSASARFSRLSVEEGLSQSSVESIAEDRYGFLWFGTQEGLNRFDGYEFTVHQSSELPGRLRDGFIRAIAADRRGDLWIGTESGVQHLDVASGRFGESVSPPGIGVRLNTIRVASDGRIWFGGISGGLFTRAVNATAPAHRVATDLVGDTDLVTATAFDAAGRLWVASSGRLLIVRPSTRGSELAIDSRQILRDVGFIRVIHVDASGILWLGRQGGPPIRFDPRSGEAIEYPELPHFVLTMIPAGDGHLWVGGKDAGLTRFDPATREMVTYRHEPGNEGSLAENDVAAIHQDRGGSLWVGAWNGGLSRLDLYAQQFRTLRNNPARPDSLPDDKVTELAEGPDGRLWTMSRNNVLAGGSPETGSFSVVPTDRDLTTIAIAGDRLFAGTTTGLVEVDSTSNRVVAARPSIREAGLDRTPIHSLHGNRDSLWIVSRGKLHLLNAGDGGLLRSAQLPLDDQPASLFAPSPERLWIAYTQGILLLAERGESGDLTVRPVGGGALSARGRLTAVTEDRGVVWIGAARGIGRVIPAEGRVVWIALDRGLSNRSVSSILADGTAVLWFATNQGITRFDPARGTAVHLGGVQGAQASGYVDGGATRGRSGLLYFAGRGITMFDPRQVVDNPHRPRVLFTALEILHRPVVPAWMDEHSPLTTGIHAVDEVTLGPGAVVFSVEMAAPGVSDPDHVLFAHRLEGFEDSWIETTAERRVATYTHLPPGNYVLRARAQTQSGLWSSEETTLPIRILPPWWRSPAAIALWFATLLLVVALLLREIQRRTRVRVALAQQEVLRRASVTDPLTGLYNRRFLSAWLEHELPRALRTHRSTAGAESRREFLHILMVDLDNLKEINDAFGHDAGDRAIRAVADLLQLHARADDVAIRFGGDEFMLVVRSTDPAHASDIAERLRRRAEAVDLALPESWRSTISVGFAVFPFLGHDPEALTWEQTMQIADRALLLSKRRGRNTWTGLVATPSASAAGVLEALKASMREETAEETARKPSVFEVVERTGSLEPGALDLVEDTALPSGSS